MAKYKGSFKKGIAADGMLSIFIMLSGVALAKVAPFIAPALGAFAVYIWTVSENNELDFKFSKALINSFTGAIIGQSLVYFMNIRIGLDDEGIFYLGLLVGSLSPIAMMIITDNDFIISKVKGFVQKFAGGGK